VAEDQGLKADVEQGLAELPSGREIGFESAKVEAFALF
jgi:hypothetical protein